MSLPMLTIDDVTQVFPLSDGNNYVALKNIHLDVAEGEFISLIGHSGCGKSTLLNLMAGLSQASSGGVLMSGREVTEPGPDRMVVFQNYSLLPWQTVRQNIALAVNNVMASSSAQERNERIDSSIQLVGLSQASNKYPAELSGGMKQRVAIARALALRPKVLLLDEPFGALDALTRGNLQQQLMQICQQAGVTTVMVTHDVDEALLLSDRVICLSNGPAAGIGQILNVDLPRPRQRLEVMEHPDYYRLRSELINFLQQQRRLKQRKQQRQRLSSPIQETQSCIRLGYLPGLDVAPLAMAMERGLLKAAQLELRPIAFDRWQTLEDRLINGELDVAITSATTPLALTMGLHGAEPWPAITPMTVTRSGNALCLARRFRDMGITDLASFAERIKGREWPLRIAVAQQGNMQELLLRHWLASGGIDPDRDVELIGLSPLAMEATLLAGEIDGFIAGRYRVAKALDAGLVDVLATDLDIWSDHPEKVLCCHEAWAELHPQTLRRLCAALMQGGQLCEDFREHDNLVALLGQPQWLGSDSRPALERQLELGTPEPLGKGLPLNRYHSQRAHLANAAEGGWILTQFSRWGLSPFPSNRLEVLSQVYRNDLCTEALEEAGFTALPPDWQPLQLVDGLAFDQNNPLAYLEQLPYQKGATVAPVELPSTATGSTPVAAIR